MNTAPWPSGFVETRTLGRIICFFLLVLPAPFAQAISREIPRERQEVLESHDLSKALLNHYLYKYALLPPSMADEDPERIDRMAHFLSRVFPRSKYANGWPDELDLGRLDPAEVLVFFLGGVPSSGIPRECLGFSADPTDPFSRPLANKLEMQRDPLYKFDVSRLVDIDNDGFWEYLPPNAKVPYVYFDNKSYGFVYDELQNIGFGIATSYKSSETGTWYQPEYFQIISAGQDDHYGSQATRIFPSLVGFSEEDYDNTTNFLDVSFGTILLREEAKSGYGQLSVVVVHLLCVILPPLAWIAWEHRTKFSLKQLFLLITCIACILAAFSWDASHMRTSNYFQLLFRNCSGTGLAALWLSLIFTMLHAASKTPKQPLSRMIYFTSIWLACLPFAFVWWPEAGETLFVSFANNYNSGWPFRTAKAGQIYPSTTSIILDLAVGLMFAVVCRYLIWRRLSVSI